MQAKTATVAMGLVLRHVAERKYAAKAFERSIFCVSRLVGSLQEQGSQSIHADKSWQDGV